MSVIKIRQAQREGARMLIMLAGVSGGGKTRTALELAYGLTGADPSKIGFLDTENRRGSLYADVFHSDRANPSREPFLIGDLYPPFSPERYVAAIHEFERAGVEVLIVDSGSHEWEGIGGCVDIAEAGNPRLPNWNKAKGEHKRFMSALLTCNAHIILCLRAREKAKPEKQMVDGREKTVYVEMGLQPITEKNVLFEATVSLMVHDNGRRQEVVKCPGDLLPILGRGEGHITADDGAALREWIQGARQLDPKVEEWRNRLISITEKGRAYVDECWGKVPAKIKASLGQDFLDTLYSSADAHEQMLRDAEAAGAEGQDPSVEGLGASLATTAEEAPPPPAVEAPEPPVPSRGPMPESGTGAALPPPAANDNNEPPAAARAPRSPRRTAAAPEAPKDDAPAAAPPAARAPAKELF